jgi:hypothetical protein
VAARTLSVGTEVAIDNAVVSGRFARDSQGAVALATEIDSSIAVEGPGNATLNFRVYPGSWENAAPTLSISVSSEGAARGDRVFGHIQHLSRLTVRVAQARVFLEAMLNGQIASVAGIGDCNDSVEYAVTEQGHTFTIYRRGQQRALRRFTLTWSQGVDWIAKPLLAKLGKAAAKPEPPNPQPPPSTRTSITASLTAPLTAAELIRLAASMLPTTAPPAAPSATPPAPIIREPVIHAAPVMPLPPDVAALQAQVRQLEAENLRLWQENKSLRDMVAFLKPQRGE